MKILFWTDGFWPRIGGIETQGFEFVQGLLEKGHHVRVIAQKDEQHFADQQLHQGILIQRFDFNAIFPHRKLKTLHLIEACLERVAAEFQPDIIHLNACAGWSVVVFSLFKKILKAPLIVTVHSPFFYQNEVNPLLEKLSLQAERVCCVSNWAKDQTMKLIPSCKEKVSCIYNGLSQPKTSPLPLCFSPPVFLLMGRFTVEKGFPTAILAFSLFPDPLAKLLIVGDGNDRKALERLVEELKIQDKVKFVGAVEKEQAFFWINQASCVIVPSYFESFGLVALEAMQMERPVIASAVGGLKEIVVEGETGFLVEPQNPLALVRSMQKLLTDRKKAVLMGQKGRQRALKLFPLSQNILQYEQLYTQIDLLRN